MASRDAEVYGARALELLERARTRLAAKYGIEPKSPTIVEIFAEQKDFGVRTFGMPDNPGYLGVCFGRVVTANGPAATHGRDANWEAVLWHEFTHVITLQLTSNRMPRWLSEGISVHEELQANPAWGQRMGPRYRSMILGGELVPIGKLSSAFLSPKSPLHLQFAYFESALVVDHIVRNHGVDALKAVLHDLREGVGINAALAAHTAPMKELEKSFAEFAANEARAMAPALDWQKPPAADASPAGERALEAWATSHPTNYWALRETARRAVAAKDWPLAKPTLESLVRAFPEQTGADSAYPLLASVHRALGETRDERRVLSEFAGRDREATDAYLRLMELATVDRDWPEVRLNAERFLAVNPLLAAPYRHLAQAAEGTGDAGAAIRAFRALIRLDPPNPADAHYQLARLLESVDPADARRHVLQALEESPRHRPALQLLLRMPPCAPASAKPGTDPPR
jgi:tetratricopeptide (TPR) repeat protein